MDFARQLRVMRVVRNVSQKELAYITEIPNTYLSDIETGKVLPSPDWEARIRAALCWPENAESLFAALEGGPKEAN